MNLAPLEQVTVATRVEIAVAVAAVAVGTAEVVEAAEGDAAVVVDANSVRSQQRALKNLGFSEFSGVMSRRLPPEFHWDDPPFRTPL
jgi:hypothetical protein